MTATLRHRRAIAPAASDGPVPPAGTALTRRRRMPRWLITMLATAGLWCWQLGSAQAADGTSGQAPGALSWIELADTRGISVWNYELSMDRGGVTSPGNFIWSFLIDIVWGLYRSCVVVAIWFLDWVISFAWLPLVATPVLALGDSLQTVVDRFGVGPMFATAAALVAVTWMARGRWALGVFELLTSLVIAALAVGVFANPVEKVAGDDGLIINTRDVGMELAAGLANNGDTTGDADAMREQVTGTLVDTFIRMPTAMINFGQVLDGGECESSYDDVLRAGPYGNDDDIRTAIAGCDEAMGETAANPGPGQLASSVIIGPSAALVLLFALVLAGAVMLAAAYALYQALRGIVTVILAVLPGAARGSLWQTLADLTMALVTVIFAVVFLTSYLIFIQGLFTSSSSGSQGAMATFFLADVMLVIGIVLFWKGRKKLRTAADRLAAALAKRPGAGPTALPARRQSNPSELYYRGKVGVTAGKAAAGGAAAIGRGWLAAGRSVGGAAIAAGGLAGGLAGKAAGAASGWGGQAAAGTAAGAAQTAAAAGPGQLLAGAGPLVALGQAPNGGGSPGGSAAAAVQHRVGAARAGRSTGGKLLMLGTQIAAAAVTGGSAAALSAGGQVAAAAAGGGAAALSAGGHAAAAATAIRAAQSARRIALAGRLAIRALPAGPASSPRPPVDPATARPAGPGTQPGGSAAAAFRPDRPGSRAGRHRAQPARLPATPSAPAAAPDTPSAGSSAAATQRGAAPQGAPSAGGGTTAPGPRAARDRLTPGDGSKASESRAGRRAPLSAGQPIPAVSGEVVWPPRATGSTAGIANAAGGEDRAARLRADLAARRAATTRSVSRATSRAPQRPGG